MSTTERQVLWRTNQPSWIPAQAAMAWAHLADREVEPGSLSGRWSRDGKSWSGMFQLVDGTRTYHLVWERGEWRVEV